MRSCLFQLALLAVLGLAVLWVALPVGASILALNALQAAGFSGSGSSLNVAARVPLTLLAGHADTIRLRSSDAAIGDVHAGGVDLTFGNVDLFSRSFGTVRGSLSDVGVVAPDGSLAIASTVTLEGAANAASASLLLAASEAESLVAARVRDVTGQTAQVGLVAPDRMSVTLDGSTIGGRLAVHEGSLALIPDNARLPTIPLVVPGNGNPFTLTGVSVGADGLHLTATIDVAALLR